MKYKTYITQEEMLAAKNDDVILMDIMSRIDLYVHKVVEIMYNKYGGRYDSAVSREDLYCFCQYNIVAGIRSYYHPERYNPKLDKKGIYKNGFTFIVNITNKFIKYFWKHRNRQKRIPLEMISSLDKILDDSDTALSDFLGKRDDIRETYIGPTLDHFKKKSKINGISPYEVVKEILTNHPTYTILAKHFGITSKEMKKVILSAIVKPHTRGSENGNRNTGKLSDKKRKRKRV